MAKRTPKRKPKKIIKMKTVKNRRRLALYTKAPFRLTTEHHKAFLSAFNAIGIVRVTYKLTLDRMSVQTISFGAKDADLKADQTADASVFKNSTPLTVPVTDGMLWVVVRTEGKFHQGGGWEMEISVNGSTIPDSPIKEEIESNNKADHDELHSIS